MEDYPRTVIILTDGSVSNEDQIIKTIYENNNRMSFCSVGIGNGISDYLIKNMGEAGKCTSVFVSDNMNLAEKAAHIL